MGKREHHVPDLGEPHELAVRGAVEYEGLGRRRAPVKVQDRELGGGPPSLAVSRRVPQAVIPAQRAQVRQTLRSCCSAANPMRSS